MIITIIRFKSQPIHVQRQLDFDVIGVGVGEGGGELLAHECEDEIALAGDRWSRESRPHPCLPYPHGGSAHRGCC